MTVGVGAFGPGFGRDVDIHGHLTLDNQVGGGLRRILPEPVRRVVGSGIVLDPPRCGIPSRFFGFGAVLIHVERDSVDGSRHLTDVLSLCS